VAAAAASTIGLKLGWELGDLEAGKLRLASIHSLARLFSLLFFLNSTTLN